MKKNKLTTRMITQIGMLGAIATVLMLFEIPLPFAPSFYEIDFSEVPVLIGCFSMGPMAGALIELVKIILNFVINGTTTAGVGEVANYVIGISFCLPAAIRECLYSVTYICSSFQNANRRSCWNGDSSKC